MSTSTTRHTEPASNSVSVGLDEDAAAILARAAERGTAKGLRYAGEVTPAETYALQKLGKASIVDIRSRFEHEYIGRIADSRLIEWKSWTSGELNANFIAELAQHYGKDQPLLLLCRSGVRSHAAAQAAAAAGFTHAYNILEGFEGDLDAEQHRGTLGGWRMRGLPWIQS